MTEESKNIKIFDALEHRNGPLKKVIPKRIIKTEETPKPKEITKAEEIVSKMGKKVYFY